MRGIEAMVDITIGSLAGAGTILLAAETLPPEISSWANLGGTVILSVLAVWLITKHLPAMSKDHQASLQAVVDKEQAGHQIAIDKIVEAHKKEAEANREMLREERELDRQSRHEAANQLQEIANKIYLCERARTRNTEGQG